MNRYTVTVPDWVGEESVKDILKSQLGLKKVGIKRALSSPIFSLSAVELVDIRNSMAGNTKRQIALKEKLDSIIEVLS
jgi:hypothetical protein